MRLTGLEFTALVSQYQGLVYTVCHQMVQDPETAQDLAQETFLAAWRSIDRCPAGYEKQWLVRIATNKARDHLKSAWNRRMSVPGDEVLALSGAPPEQLPEELVASADGAQWLRQLILQLKEPYHTPARLYFLEQHTVEETARLCGRPAKTVSAQLFRARRMLQKEIEERRAKDGTV